MSCSLSELTPVPPAAARTICVASLAALCRSCCFETSRLTSNVPRAMSARTGATIAVSIAIVPRAHRARRERRRRLASCDQLHAACGRPGIVGLIEVQVVESVVLPLMVIVFDQI